MDACAYRHVDAQKLTLTISGVASDPYPLKRGDTDPPIQATLRQANKKPVPLGGCTVRFIMRPAPGIDAPLLAAAAEVLDEAAGKVRYQWVDGDTDVVGVYRAVWEVTFPTGRVRTVPTKGWIDVVIEDDLG